MALFFVSSETSYFSFPTNLFTWSLQLRERFLLNRRRLKSHSLEIISLIIFMLVLLRVESEKVFTLGVCSAANAVWSWKQCGKIESESFSFFFLLVNMPYFISRYTLQRSFKLKWSALIVTMLVLRRELTSAVSVVKRCQYNLLSLKVCSLDSLMIYLKYSLHKLLALLL